MSKEIREYLSEMDPEILCADGYDEALIGYVDRFGQEPVALYDRARYIALLVERDGMTEDEAEEFFAFNVIGAWVGEYTPAFATLLATKEKS